MQRFLGLIAMDESDRQLTRADITTTSTGPSNLAAARAAQKAPCRDQRVPRPWAALNEWIIRALSSGEPRCQE